jgi:hypothetical protein
VNFESQAEGTTGAPKSVQLNNAGTAPLVVSSITPPSLPFADPHMAASCPSSDSLSLAPIASGAISLALAPASTGPFTSSVLINDNASGSPQTISLRRAGVQQASLSPTTLNFNNIGFGASNTTTATLANNLNTPLSFTATASGDFAVVGNGCAAIVPADGPNSHCSTRLSFKDQVKTIAYLRADEEDGYARVQIK